MQEGDYDTVTVTGSKVLLRADQRVSILLRGHRRANELYSVAFEVTLETIPHLRAELEKAQAYLSQQAGRA
jgi:hypothetical protein